MTFGTASVPFLKRPFTAPKAAVAWLSALLFIFVLHLGLGAGLASSVSTSLGAADHVAVRHSALVRDGLKPVVAADHGDRTSAPPPQSPAVPVFGAVIAARPSGFLCLLSGAETLLGHHHCAAHRPRAPPIAA
ncbi:hypothetical protein [Pleomorphomonas oryzae]|uniref:hypothetical protein n=1 Tax=Pleomorphomonas oryzae TaxID=261934 RepID=UPI00040B631D|nr:hypothetical protein [Pleomorphomonas oryzae]